jgi:hypothetical protein
MANGELAVISSVDHDRAGLLGIENGLQRHRLERAILMEGVAAS